MPDDGWTWFPDINWDKFWQVLIVTINESIDSIVSALAPVLQNVVPLVVGFVVQTFISLVANAGRAIGEAVDEYEANSGMQILEMAAAGLSDFFGVPIGTADIGLRGGTQARRETSDRLGRLVVEQMFANMSSGGLMTPEKGLEGAERLVGFSMSNALEGWLGTVLQLPFVNKWIPSWGDLDEAVAKNMGVGSAASRAMAPILDATVSIPFRWHVNKLYSPTILGPAEAVKAWIQGSISEEEYFELQARHGLPRQYAATMKLLKGRFPFKYDIERMFRLGMFSQEEMVELLRKRGFLPEIAELLTEMYQRLGEDSANRRTATVAADMFRDGEIDEAEFRAILADVGLTPEEIEARIGLGLLERARPRRLPRSVMESGFRAGLIKADRLRSYYEGLGYNDEDVGILMEIQLAKGEPEPKLLPRAVIEKAFIRGYIPRARLVEYYQDSEYEPEQIEIFMELMDAERKAWKEKQRAQSQSSSLN